MYNTMNNPSAHPSYSHYYLLSPSTLFFVFFFCTSYCFFAHLVVFLHISLSFAHLIVFCTSYCFLHILLFCTFLFHCTFYSYFSFSYHMYALVLCYLYNLYSYCFALSTERTWFDCISLLVMPCITIMWQIKKPWTLNTYTTSLGPIIQAHGFSYHFYADDTQLYLSFRPDDPTVAARISGCLDLGVDERTSPTAQPGKDWASCLPCNSNSTAWFYHPAKFFYNYPIKFSQKSWGNLWWSADLQRAHCKDCSILQVCTTQHQKDQVLPYTACSTTSCVKCFITSTSCDSLPLYNVSLIRFLNCKSLWIKASAKWIHINVSKHLFGGQIQLIRVTNTNQKPQSQPPLGSN